MATTRIAIAPMKAAQVTKPGGDFEIVEREIRPGALFGPIVQPMKALFGPISCRCRRRGHATSGAIPT